MHCQMRRMLTNHLIKAAFEDSHLIVVNKPYGMLSVPGKTNSTLFVPRFIQWKEVLLSVVNCSAQLNERSKQLLTEICNQHSTPRRKLCRTKVITIIT